MMNDEEGKGTNKLKLRWSKFKTIAAILGGFNLGVLFTVIKRSNLFFGFSLGILVLNSTYLGGVLVLCNEKILELSGRKPDSKGFAITKTLMLVFGWFFLVLGFVLSLQKVLSE